MRCSRVTAIRLASLTAIVLLAADRPASGQQPWYYRGAVINDGPPARSAVLEFAVSERSDTAMVGWLRVHLPLGGSGFAYAELGGDSLEIVTVSAKGDTAVWQSATYGRQLGGRYHVTGGRSAGETGSWSLAGASDPSRAIRIPLAIVLGIALVGGLFLAARQIAPAWWRTRAPLALSPETSERLTGVGGWLAWYLFANVLTAGVLVYRLPTIGSVEGGSSWLMGDIFAGLRPLIVMEEAVHVAQLAGILVGAALLLKRRPETPAYWTLFLGTLALYGMIDLFAMGELGHRLGRMFGEEFRKEFIDGSATERRQNGRLVAGAFVWGLYWLLSKRVHLTFAPRENALVVPSEPAVIEEEQAAEARGEMATAVSTTPAAYPSVIPRATPQLTEPTREGLSRRRAAVAVALAGVALLFIWAPGRDSDDDTKPGAGGSGSTGQALTPRDIAVRARAATVQLRALDSSGAVAGEGTGFFLSKDGLIGTNLHVIRDAQVLQVRTLSGDIYDSILYVTADARGDVAILKVPTGDARALPLALDTELDVGDPVYVMGNPLGQIGTFSDGLVSARRMVNGVSLLQISAPVSPGSSGGPVLNGRGEVVGMATLMLRGGQNLNYAVPVRYIRPLLATSATPRRYAAHLLPRPADGLSGTDLKSRRGRAAAGATRSGDVVAKQFVRSDSIMRSLGAAPIGAIRRGSLDDSASTSLPIELSRGQEYAVSGYCDDECTDLDLTLATPRGKSLDADIESDDYPYLRFIAPATGTYRLKVTMAACGVARCGYGIRFYRF